MKMYGTIVSHGNKKARTEPERVTNCPGCGIIISTIQKEKVCMKIRIAAILRAIRAALRKRGHTQYLHIHDHAHQPPHAPGRCGGCDRIWR